jgi:hypothetical protein
MSHIAILLYGYIAIIQKYGYMAFMGVFGESYKNAAIW